MSDNYISKDEQNRIKFENFISDLFIKAIEKGNAPWTKPWTNNDMLNSLARNPETGTVYQGNNQVILMTQALANGYNDPRWLTFNQAKAAGGIVNKGEKGTMLKKMIYEKEVEKLDENGKPLRDANGKVIMEKQDLEKPFPKYFYVFNVKQMTFPPEHRYSKPLENKVESDQKQIWDNLDSIENLIKDTGVNLVHSGNRAFYNSGMDMIVVPEKNQFKTQEGYYSTILHEMSHWTGHVSRLDRLTVVRKGTKAYAKEELIAEISSFMLCVKHGIGYNLENHANYVEGYLSLLKDDKNEIIKATKEAYKAQNLISKGSQLKILEEEKIVLHSVAPIDKEKILENTDKIEGDEVANSLMQKGAYFDVNTNSFYVTKKTHDLEKFSEYLPREINEEKTLEAQEAEVKKNDELKNSEESKKQDLSNTDSTHSDQELKNRAKSISEICELEEVKSAMDRIGLDNNLKNDILDLFNKFDKLSQSKDKTDKIDKSNDIGHSRGR